MKQFISKFSNQGCNMFSKFCITQSSVSKHWRPCPYLTLAHGHFWLWMLVQTFSTVFVWCSPDNYYTSRYEIHVPMVTSALAVMMMVYCFTTHWHSLIWDYKAWHTLTLTSDKSKISWYFFLFLYKRKNKQKTCGYLEAPHMVQKLKKKKIKKKLC